MNIHFTHTCIWMTEISFMYQLFLLLFLAEKWKLLSRVRLFATPWTIPFVEFSRPEYWSGSFSLLQGIFPTQWSNPGLPHCRRILYQLSHKGGLRILEWVAYPFSSGSSWPRNQTGVSCIASRLFTNLAIREAGQRKAAEKQTFALYSAMVTLLWLVHTEFLAK